VRTLVGSSEGWNTDRNVNSEDWAHEVSGGNKDSIVNWTRAHSCYIEAKNLSAFFPCSQTL
jgi:hypothetical protein